MSKTVSPKSAASDPGFVHLHVHSAYSLLQGSMTISKLLELAKADHQPALALTDNDNMFGALEFSDKLAGYGIQPITGCAMTTDFGDQDASARNALQPARLVLLATSEDGYRSLMKLNSRAFLETPVNQPPHIKIEWLEGETAGLIALTGGPEGPIGQAINADQPALAQARCDILAKLFGDRLYIELQRHGLENERRVEPALIDMAYAMGLPLVATNQPYFATADDYEAHDALLCIAGGRLVSETDRDQLTPDHRFKTRAEMAVLFADLPEALTSTVEIAKRCSYRPKTRKPILPRFTVGGDNAADGENAEAEELRRQAEEGLAWRLQKYGLAPGTTEEDYAKRLAFEIDVITRMKYPGYFLIVSDFIKWAKSHGIPVGPGRGSGAGSLVAYALTITDLDPIRFGLLFERFLNPERVSMPDFDIDFCQDRRGEVIRYVQERYGREQVGQIITFGTLQARGVLRDVGRVLQMPYGQVDRLTKLVPQNPAAPVTLAAAIASEPKLQAFRDEDPVVARAFDIAQRLEGLTRHASTHAAGIVIGDRPLSELVPMYRDPKSDMPVTQFNMKWVELAGLVKFDFLGLKTLTVLQRAVGFLANRGIEIDLASIPLDDAKTFEMLSEGDTVGVFQLESSGMRDVLKGLKPDRFEDIIAVVALYRPGPMENIKHYVARKHDPSQVTYMHPKLEPVLAETYGIMIYQEQVQQAARVLAGYTLGEADLLRRAMGKKIKEEMDKQRQTFIEGSTENGLTEQLASDVFDQIGAFAGYGFNKSHAAAYALVSYQTAWLKANYPEEFIAASMALDAGSTDKLAVFRQECQREGIDVRPPDVNHSGASFTVEQSPDGSRSAIRYALGAVRNVGSEAMSLLVGEREANGPFADLADFLRRLPREAANRRQLEHLIRAGALDSLHENRRELIGNMDGLLGYAETIWRDSQSNQDNLFGGSDDLDSSVRLKPCDDWSGMDRLREEFESLGLYLSAHPLDGYVGKLEKLKVINAAQLAAMIESRNIRPRVNLAGSVTAKQVRISQRGNKFAFVQFTDQTGVFEITFFSDILSESQELLDSDMPVLVSANIRLEENGPRITAARVQALDEAIAAWNGGVGIWLQDERPLPALKSLLDDDGPGRAEVKLRLMIDNQEVSVALPGRFKLSGEARRSMRQLPGVLSVQEI